MFFLLVSTLLWTTTASSASYVDPQSCPSTPICTCKWSGGKEVADCSNRGLVQIPSTLGNNVQSLILDGNPLTSLKRDAFKSVGLSNLQTLSLKGCQLTRVEEGAFRELKVLQNVDLSRNNLTGIGTDLFDGNENLRTIRITHNPISRLEAFQFPRLANLKRIDLSSCRVSAIDRMAFKNLGGGSLHFVNLDNNRLSSIAPEVFVPLTSLRNLQLRGNPWVCDCKLRNFRDWLVDNDLYGRPTRCSEPARLIGKTWDEIRTGDFACRPSVYSPSELVFASAGTDVTLACRISGSPTPSARWVVKGRIINNHTRAAAFSNPTWIIREDVPDGSFGRWYNLTIVDPGHDNLGDYICVAENTAGVMEGKVTLTFDDPASIYGNGGGGGDDDDDGLIVGAATASACFLLLVLLIICYCFYLRRRKTSKHNSSTATAASTRGGDKMFGNESGVALLPYGGSGGSVLHHRSDLEYRGLLSPEESDSLLMPIHRQHIMTAATTLPHNNEVEMRQLRAGSVTSTAQTTPRPQTSSSGGEGSSCHSNSTTNAGGGGEKSPQPDLILTERRPMMMKKTSTPMNLTASSLMMMRQGQPSPVPSTISSVATASPFQRSGTLPVQYIYNPSCQTLSRNVASSPEAVGVPSHLLPLLNGPHRQHQHPPRPGYVTLPRRPKNHRDSPSPALLYLTLNRSNRASPLPPRNPVYDGVGPRTSADGSSRNNLNKTFKKFSAPPVLVNSVAGKRTSFSSTSGLPPPIDEELRESPFSIDKNLGNSTPNILSARNEDRLNGTNGIAGCLNGNVTTTSNANGELALPEAEEENASGYFEPFGKAELPEKSEKEAEVGQKCNNMPRKPSGLSAKRDGFRPIPPPKPRQRLAPGQVRKQFQDEGVDGSEV